MVIGIIGAGASGMAAAISAAQDEKTKVLLFERQNRVGKKLAITGNGRCNLSNINATKGGYHGNTPYFSSYAINTFSPQKTLDWFENLGLFTTVEKSGRVYPYSDQANSVLDILRFALNKKNIELYIDHEIRKVKKIGSIFLLESNDKTFRCDKLIIACGGIAGSKAGGCLSGYKLLQSFGHSATKLRPSLVQIKTDWSGISALKGIRANCKATICLNRKELISSEGEIQFTDYGLSGPVIFEISRDVCTKSGKWECKLDLIPSLDNKTLLAELKRRQGTDLLTDDILTGILHNRLGRVITKHAGIKNGIPVKNLTVQSLENLCDIVKEFYINLTAPNGMENAQVTAGGILTDEFYDTTMESRLVPGLYSCGEVLDIDGDCGGYNLQWAWSSGILAGLSARKDIK